ncbi:MAG: transglutaminase family protein [Leptolyngbyaceae cyanobacterium bins.302]|nr:transglutaminase family protein [Leptolyngbyaceae cyanobacterium bins.302]
MKYQISHSTEYQYSDAVILQPHLIRLRPRSDSGQILHVFELQISPQPQHISQIVDLDGNTIAKVWFAPEPTRSLAIHALSQIETTCTNPFDYLLEPWATQLPIDYPALLLSQLHPYLEGQHPSIAAGIDPAVVQLAQELWMTADGNPISFLSHLNQQIYQQCEYSLRETGNPLPPGITWSQKAGSCRDYAVLFMEVCRAVGLATRFVSGYQEGDLEKTAEFHLHAWAEVYLPGAGWRGYDPTQGLAVSDRHIALVASAFSVYAAPVAGCFNPGGTSSKMSYQLLIQGL